MGKNQCHRSQEDPLPNRKNPSAAVRRNTASEPPGLPCTQKIAAALFALAQSWHKAKQRQESPSNNQESQSSTGLCKQRPPRSHCKVSRALLYIYISIHIYMGQETVPLSPAQDCPNPHPITSQPHSTHLTHLKPRQP